MKKDDCSPKKEHLSPAVEGAAAIIKERFAYVEGLEEIAAELMVTKAYLVRAFHNQMGLTPGDYLQMCRLDHAKKLLCGSDIPIELVAQACGYANGNYFAKVFRRTFGITPLSYRRKHGARPGTEQDVLYL